MTGVAIFMVMLWATYFADLILPVDLTTWGIIPRTSWGLVGIPLAPFLHASFGHLLGNTLPLVVLLALMAGSRTRTWETTVEIVLLGGGLLWLFGRNGTPELATAHVGASGLVYGLAAFLIVAGFREKRFVPLIVAIGVAFIYGTTLLYGVLPTIGRGVSWDGHLTSAIAGAALAYFTLGNTESPDKTTLLE